MAYTRVNWQDSPNTTTPLSADNLNKMDVAIASLDSTMSAVRSEANSARINAEQANTLATENKGRLDALDTTVEQLESQVDQCPVAIDYANRLLADWNTNIVSEPTIVHFYQIGAIMFVHLVFRTVQAVDTTDEYTVGRLEQAFLPQHHHSFACAAINTDTGTITTEGATLQSDGLLQLHLTKSQSANTYLFDLNFFYCLDH